jgi:hypothetical protein
VKQAALYASRANVAAPVGFLIGMAVLFSGSSTTHRMGVDIRKEKKAIMKREKAALVAIEGQAARIPQPGTDTCEYISCSSGLQLI